MTNTPAVMNSETRGPMRLIGFTEVDGTISRREMVPILEEDGALIRWDEPLPEIWADLSNRQRVALLRLAAEPGLTRCEGAWDLTFCHGILQCGGGFALTERGKRVAEYGREHS